MREFEVELREFAQAYIERSSPISLSPVTGICLTGSLAVGYVDEYSDIDLTLVVDDTDTTISTNHFESTILPDAAVVQRRDPLTKYSFNWNDVHFDIDVVQLDQLRADLWDLQTRWEYDHAEVLRDPSGTVTERLDREVPFAEGERNALVSDYVDEFLFVAQWDVHKACLREAPQVAHLAAANARESLLTLFFLDAGEFRPRDKWIMNELANVDMVDQDILTLVWEALRVTEQTSTDVARRVRALRTLWDELKPSLAEQELINPTESTWEAPVDELCQVT